MAQEPTQAQAGAASEARIEADRNAETNSLQHPGKEPTFDERVGGAKTPDDVNKLIADAVAGRAGRSTAPEEQSLATETGAAPTLGAGDDKTATTTEEQPAEAKGEKPAEAAGDPAAAQPKEEAGEETPATGKEEAASEEQLPERMRLTNFSKVEKLALTLKRENPKLTLAEAEKRAKDALGIVDEAPAAEKQAAGDGLPETMADLETQLADLVAQRTKAFEEDLDFKAGNQLTNKIDALREHKLTLREQSTKQESEKQRTYNTAFDAAEKKAASLYDFTKQAESAGYKRMAEIDAQLEANGDPLFHAPDKPLKIAQMVAAELAIAPKSPTAKAAVKPAATVPPVTQKKPVPPVVGGESRTSTSTTQEGETTKKILSLRTPADLEDFLAGKR